MKWIESFTNPLFLAPMAGFSDLAFRSVVKKFGCDVTTSEMISSNALVYECKKTLTMLKKSESEKPFVVQIAGSDEEIIKKAVLLINELDYVDGIDLNCGCPVNKVIKQNAGSALLNDLEKLKKILSAIKENNKKASTSIKIRIGFNKDEIETIIPVLNDFELDYISIHARTRKDLYNNNLNYNAIKKAKELSNTKIIANGNINYDNHKQILEITKADGLMIGRACIGEPWIFSQIKQNKKDVSKKEIILYHFEKMREIYNDKASSIFRKHLHEYSKAMPNASEFRNAINKISDEKVMINKISEFFNE
ncbi:tRNA dihydrouridine synthase [Campylobacter canadensis]|uniref:tRNA-dihydrouridine synthase n=1 Tax=Campylobacter canadensis TaxID=449520 RepID=A0ABS7WVL8_9BACT|nr:tRNA-dihydrouridine synthase [Campylobacter canadensis]MBZ7988010.1 tRNA-dihydrouridine synthase [Campylobacter canadensis]MBZ7995445.1 tRNA-dihydrouridine synthase [Campylobacter canadensis]MBZ7997243.1 tRNA-dihydrouridine synthase [Campylobacter canadensis]MBZ7998974.1 tRNA-dihydrouridine synthase [Campylobacter canadensis]MBZ8000792.1 tRNA-dihydrouridine synthase [Campylobacter canadensis]